MKKNGFTLAETLMVVAITTVVAALALFAFANYGSTEALAKDQGRVVSVLEKARALTLDSKNNSVYGVHFGTSTLTIFSGASYSPVSATNIVTDLNSKVQIQSVTLAGGTNDLIFNRLSGQTNQPGTVRLSLVSATSTVKLITVYATGLIQPN